MRAESHINAQEFEDELGRAFLFLFILLGGDLKEFSYSLEVFLFGMVGEEAEVPHTKEAPWEDVKQEATNELRRIEDHDFQVVVLLAIPVGEGDLAVAHVHNAIV